MNEIPQLALSALAAVISGYLLFIIKSDRARITRDTNELGLKISCESEERAKAISVETRERQNAITDEANARRAKDEDLGSEIVRLRLRLAYERGKQRKPFTGGAENGDREDD